MQTPGARFKKSDRLLDAAAYDWVFKRAGKSSDDFFTILWRPNGLQRSRLGLAVSKKNLRQAVDRNRVKRIVRESFRLHRIRSLGVDAVVLTRRGVQAADRVQLRKSLSKHWQRLGKQVERISGQG